MNFKLNHKISLNVNFIKRVNVILLNKVNLKTALTFFNQTKSNVDQNFYQGLVQNILSNVASIKITKLVAKIPIVYMMSQLVFVG